MLRAIHLARSRSARRLPERLALHASLSDRLLEDPSSRPAMTSHSQRRTGLIAYKCGMTAEWTEHGNRIALTILHVDNCQVTQVKSPSTDGYSALQLAAGSKRPKRVAAPQRGHFAAAGVDCKRTVGEFRVTEDALLPVGTRLNATHFRPGQLVDVVGTSKGKGFAGVMKRHNFKGQPASHGTGMVHRRGGSISSLGLGRVWPGKKMAGHMGNARTTVQSQRVHKIDLARNLIFVAGAVPGPVGGAVFVRDALRDLSQGALDVPFPAFVEGVDEVPHLDEALGEARAPAGRNPYHVYLK